MTEDALALADLAARLAAQGGEIALGYFHRGVVTEDKGDRDLVSIADREVEQLLRDALAAAVPDHAVVGEEAGGQAADGQIRWYLDPVDGTVNFLQGLDWWGVSVGVCDADDRLLAGAVALPARRELYVAARGLGARKNGAPLRLRGPQLLRESLVGWTHTRGIGGEGWGEHPAIVAALRRLSREALGTRSFGSCSADLCAVASGRLHAFWSSGQSRWDVAAGLLIAREAGATVTDPAGTTVDGPVGAFLASAPGVHAVILEAIRAG